MNKAQLDAYATALIDVLTGHDQKRGDLSYRLEGTLEAIGCLAKTADLSEPHKTDFSEAVIRACVQYGQFETIGRGANAKPWPTNRYALQAFADLGIQRPLATAA